MKQLRKIILSALITLMFCFLIFILQSDMVPITPYTRHDDGKSTNTSTDKQNVTRQTVKKQVDYIKWLMLAGDSNMRKTFYRIIEKLEADLEFPNSSILDISHSNLGRAKDSRWFDRDFIIHFKNQSLLRVSQRFLHGDYRELYRLNNHWTDIRFCFTNCKKSDLPSKQKQVFQSTSKPDLLFITRGLWETDQIKIDKTCHNEHKYANIIKNFTAEVKVVWQNNPRIYGHSKIKNWQIEHDAKCQREFAKKHHLDIFDLYNYTSQNMKERMLPGDYHISFSTRDFLFHLMWEKLWKN